MQFTSGKNRIVTCVGGNTRAVQESGGKETRQAETQQADKQQALVPGEVLTKDRGDERQLTAAVSAL